MCVGVGGVGGVGGVRGGGVSVDERVWELFLKVMNELSIIVPI